MDQPQLAVVPEPTPTPLERAQARRAFSAAVVDATGSIRTGLLMAAEKCSGELVKMLQQGSDNWNKMNALVEIASKAMAGVRAAGAESADAQADLQRLELEQR